MSLSGSLFNGVSGLQTAQRQINVTSGNVSNANVDGYSQKTAAAVTRLVDGQNSGVKLGPIQREVDTYLDSEAMRARTELGALDTRSAYLNRIGEMFGTLSSDSTLSNGLNALSSALEKLSVEPESASVRSDVVEAADALARQLRSASTETTDLRTEASNEIDQGVQAINDALSQVAELNDEISRANALGRPTADLEDERDRQLETLSEWMDVNTFDRENGAIAVMGKMGDGSTKMLVDSTAVAFDFSKANALGPEATSSDGTPTLTSAGTPAAGSEKLGARTGGKIGALLDVRDNLLPDFHSDLDRLTQVVRDRINAAHNLGTHGNAGAATITGSTDLSADSLAGASGELTLNEVDPTTGEVVLSTTIDLTAPPPADFNDLATNYLTVDNFTADASGDQLEITTTNGNAVTVDTGDAEISGVFGTKGFSHYFGLNNLFETPGLPIDSTDPATDITGAARQIEVRSDIKSDPGALSAGTATIRPTPPPTNNPPEVYEGDPTVAQAMAAAFEDRGTIAASGGNLKKVDTTMSGYAADVLSFQAGDTARTDTARDFQQTMYDELKLRSDSKSGVNIDEELSNMLVFEQAYNASARVISTVQQMFDTLDRMMN